MKTLHYFLSISILFLGIFSSCKKNADHADGLSYGIVGVEPGSAHTGDTVTIYGVGFQPDNAANKVTINGVDAKVVAAGKSELRVIVPDAPRNGNISVTTGSQSFNFGQTFNITTVLSGELSGDITLSTDKLWLLKGEVHLKAGATMTIKEGTTIFASKETFASLIIDDGAKLVANGTADKPIVFTSDQAVTRRTPGDWKGITLAGGPNAANANDVLQYMRIEFAGYHLPIEPGAALMINRSTAAGKMAYIETSYSAGDGFRCAAAASTTTYLKNLIAFGCAGTDFDFAGDSRVIAQFLFGIKDPVYADQYSADGLIARSSRPITVSNLTLVGPNGLSRAANSSGPNYSSQMNIDGVLNRHAGRSVHIGGYDRITGTDLGGTLQLFNSAILAAWLAGISVDGPRAWNAYGNGGSVIRRTSLTYNLATSQTTLSHEDPPQRGYCFSPENITSSYSGFGYANGTPQYDDFNVSNDTLKLQQEAPFFQSPNPWTKYDDLGVLNLVLYSKLHGPVMTIPDGSLLGSGAAFTESELGDAFIDKTISFRGAFGSVDWTKTWSNYSPQETSYN
ncbi:MAG: IPT/TIG domain-containing protein [Chitinophagaceae bacterium]|nr:IPT/TIG domain-containing protein [Chitinophagaceae bacterium]